jgi:GPH family glycoside/pentoside/hexuronide:cation symporter
MSDMPPASTSELPTLSKWTQVGWASGTLGIGTFAVGGYLLLRFMTDYLGIAPGVAGIVFASAKIFDIVMDPIVGSISDRTRSRWGRRRPYLVAGGIACGLSFMLSFNPPAIVTGWPAIAMVTGILFLNALSYAIFMIPYIAMPAEMTDRADERSQLMSFRVMFGSLSNLVGGFATTALIAWFGGGLAGHRAMGVIIGLAIFCFMTACFVFTRNAPSRPIVETAHVPMREQFKAAIANRPFLVLQCSKVMLLSAAAIHTASAPFFVQRRLALPDTGLGAIYATLTLGTILCQPFWLWLARTRGKRDAFVIAGLYTAVAWMCWLPFGAGTGWTTVLLLGTAAGIGNGGIVMLSYSMLPDTMAYEYQCSGRRIEGSFSGIYTMVEKLGGAFGSSLTGLTLAAFGYVQASAAGQQVVQSDRAIFGTAIAYTVVPSVLLLCSVAVMRFYPLDERTMMLRKRG